MVRASSLPSSVNSIDLYGAEFNKFIVTSFLIIFEIDDFETNNSFDKLETDMGLLLTSNL
jgi:hypothetical protein